MSSCSTVGGLAGAWENIPSLAALQVLADWAAHTHACCHPSRRRGTRQRILGHGEVWLGVFSGRRCRLSVGRTIRRPPPRCVRRASAILGRRRLIGGREEFPRPHPSPVSAAALAVPGDRRDQPARGADRLSRPSLPRPRHSPGYGTGGSAPHDVRERLEQLVRVFARKRTYSRVVGHG